MLFTDALFAAVAFVRVLLGDWFDRYRHYEHLFQGPNSRDGRFSNRRRGARPRFENEGQRPRRRSRRRRNSHHDTW